MPEHPPRATAEEPTVAEPTTTGTSLTQLGTRIPLDLKERLRRQVYEQRSSVQQEVIAALEAYLPH